MTCHSASSSAPGLLRMSGCTASLPMSWRSADHRRRSRSAAGRSSSSAMRSVKARTRSACPRVRRSWALSAPPERGSPPRRARARPRGPWSGPAPPCGPDHGCWRPVSPPPGAWGRGRGRPSSSSAGPPTAGRGGRDARSRPGPPSARRAQPPTNRGWRPRRAVGEGGGRWRWPRRWPRTPAPRTRSRSRRQRAGRLRQRSSGGSPNPLLILTVGPFNLASGSPSSPVSGPVDRRRRATSHGGARLTIGLPPRRIESAPHHLPRCPEPHDGRCPGTGGGPAGAAPIRDRAPTCPFPAGR